MEVYLDERTREHRRCCASPKSPIRLFWGNRISVQTENVLEHRCVESSPDGGDSSLVCRGHIRFLLAIFLYPHSVPTLELALPCCCSSVQRKGWLTAVCTAPSRAQQRNHPCSSSPPPSPPLRDFYCRVLGVELIYIGYSSLLVICHLK